MTAPPMSRAALAMMFACVLGACSSGGGMKTDGGGAGAAGLDAAGGSGGSGGGEQGTAGQTGAAGQAGMAGLGGASDGGGGTGAPVDASGDVSADVAHDKPGIFVAVGYGGRRVRSLDDGTTWVDDQSLSAAGGDDKELLRTVLWTGQQFVALGYRSMTSPDGATWQDHTLTGTDQWFGAAVFAQGSYVGVGGYGMKAISQDGIAWEAHPISGDTRASHQGNGLLYDPDHQHFVATNDGGIVAYSTDGKSWSLSTGAAGVVPTELAIGNGVIVAAGGTATVTSKDGGVSWTNGGALPAAVQALVFAQGHFTGIGANHVFTSVDGTTWTDHPTTIDGDAMAYGHGVYILFNGRSYRSSTDGVTWLPTKTLPGANSITWVTFGPTG